MMEAETVTETLDTKPIIPRPVCIEYAIAFTEKKDNLPLI
jgi:hypothetical protein